MDSIQENIRKVARQISQACERCKRDPRSITIVAVSKKKSASQIREAHQSGIIDMGENYAQEFLEKWDQLHEIDPLRWHFVGHVQRRKARELIGKITLIHSLDSYPLAWEIEKQGGVKKTVQNCLLQVSLAGEKNKSGLPPQQALPLLKDLSQLKQVNIKGLMTLPPFFPDPEQSRPYYKTLRELQDEINRDRVYRSPLTELSMGMSHDFTVAIEEGATIVRIGTAIFGERKNSNAS